MPGFAPCSDLTTRQIKWIGRRDQVQTHRPQSHMIWGISAVSIAAQYAATYADEAKGRTVDWG